MASKHSKNISVLYYSLIKSYIYIATAFLYILGAKRLGGETTSGAKRLVGAKRLGGKRPGGKRLGGETTRGGNGLGAKRPGFNLIQILISGLFVT